MLLVANAITAARVIAISLPIPPRHFQVIASLRA
jgi:hypothetical protein